MIGNGVAAVVVARWERELTRETLQKNLAENFTSAVV
jgi:Na+/H+-dicarboxylate symporter